MSNKSNDNLKASPGQNGERTEAGRSRPTEKNDSETISEDAFVAALHGKGKLEINGPILLKAGKDQYRLNLPGDVVLAICTLPAGAVIHNGRVMDEPERKFIAVHFMAYTEQGAQALGSVKGAECIAITRELLRERWPECKWDATGESEVSA